MHMVAIVQTPFNILPTRFRITSISSEKTYEVLKHKEIYHDLTC